MLNRAQRIARTSNAIANLIWLTDSDKPVEDATFTAEDRAHADQIAENLVDLADALRGHEGP